MAPNETTILTTNLLQPSQLPEILSLQAFTALFPRSQQSSPQIRALYRDLQQQRRRHADEVAANIEHEAEAAPALRRNILKARGAAGRENPDEEIEIERALDASTRNPRHQLFTIIPELNNTVQHMEATLERLQAEEARLMESTKQVVDSLSDLRYGRLNNSDLRDHVLAGMQEVQQACKRKKT